MKNDFAKKSILFFLFSLSLSSLLAQQRGGFDYELCALRQTVAQTHLKMEALETEVERLEQLIKDQETKFKAEMNQLRREMSQQVEYQRDAILGAIEPKLDKLVSASSGASAPSFSSNYPKEGLSYTVQGGDTLSKIALEKGARVEDIKNANKIADPSKLQVGQTLFIPTRN